MESRIRSALIDMGHTGFVRLFWEDDYVVIELGSQRDLVVGKNVMFTPTCHLPLIPISQTFGSKVLMNPGKIEKQMVFKVVIEVGQRAEYDRMLVIKELMKFGTIAYLDTSGILSNSPLISGKIFVIFADERGYSAAVDQRIKVNYNGDEFLVKCFYSLVKSYAHQGIIKKWEPRSPHRKFVSNSRYANSVSHRPPQNFAYASYDSGVSSDDSNAGIYDRPSLQVSENSCDRPWQASVNDVIYYSSPHHARQSSVGRHSAWYQPYSGRGNSNTDYSQLFNMPQDFGNQVQQEPYYARVSPIPPTDPRRRPTDPRLSLPPYSYSEAHL